MLFVPRLMILPMYRSQVVIPFGNKTGKKYIVHAKKFQITVTVVFKFRDLSKRFDPAYICCKVNKFGTVKCMLCYEMRMKVYFCIVISKFRAVLEILWAPGQTSELEPLRQSQPCT